MSLRFGAVRFRREGRGAGVAALTLLLPLLAVPLLAACSAAPASLATTVGGAGSVPGAELLGVTELPPAPPRLVRIPAIDVTTRQLTGLGLTRDGELEVPDKAGTAGWFTMSPTPGEPGPAVIAGHVDYAAVPGIFLRLHEMRPGDVITIERWDGISVDFTAYQVSRLPKSGFPTDWVYGNTEGPELRLITCGGAFDPATGQYSDNVVVFARMTAAYLT